MPSAIERYDNQTLRILQVLDEVLEGREYLVGDKWYVQELTPAAATWVSRVGLSRGRDADNRFPQYLCRHFLCLVELPSRVDLWR